MFFTNRKANRGASAPQSRLRNDSLASPLFACFSEDGAEILLEYSGGTPRGLLDAARMREIDQHLETCAECRKLVEAQRTVFAALDNWTAPAVSADFDQKLYARIAAEKPSFWQRFLPVTPIAWWKPAVPVALAALALSALFVIRTPHSSPSARDRESGHRTSGTGPGRYRSSSSRTYFFGDVRLE